MEGKIIGRISTTGIDFSTTDYFQFWTNVDVVLDLLDIIKVERRNGSFTYGSIESIKQVSDAADHVTNYISSGFGEPSHENVTKRIEFNLVTARFICNKPATEDGPELHTPPVNNDKVYLCTAEEIQQAMGLTGESRIPFGHMEMYGGMVKIGVELLSKMILNPDGAHMNISGISGLAAKTTTSMFILNAIQQRLAEKEKIAFVLFNVKGQDLMSIDKDSDDERNEYGIGKQLPEFKDIKYQPFQNVEYFYPVCDNTPKVNKYSFPYKTCLDRQNLDLIFAGEDDNTRTLDSIVQLLQSGAENVKDIGSWDKLKDKLKHFETTKDGEESKDENGIKNVSFTKARRIVETVATTDSIFVDNTDSFDILNEIAKIEVGQVAVIDIHSLRFCEQAFVIGSVQRELTKVIKNNLSKQASNDSPQKVVIFVDELNKFAPTTNGREVVIKKILQEIAERGRTEGTILFSAEQFRSAVDPRITGNCSTFLMGKTNSAELANSCFQNIAQECKTLLTHLKPGESLLFSPEINSYVKVKFPFPAYKLPK